MNCSFSTQSYVKEGEAEKRPNRFRCCRDTSTSSRDEPQPRRTSSNLFSVFFGERREKTLDSNTLVFFLHFSSGIPNGQSQYPFSLWRFSQKCQNDSNPWVIRLSERGESTALCPSFISPQLSFSIYELRGDQKNPKK
uniref:Uncharacterized protein n=1 Tax=Caenorhabditis tropicalis TaxID=1561998 RepID=A0A1I7U6T7_9PELO